MATRDLHTKVGEMEFENLFSGNEPAALVRGGVIAKGETETTYKRGSLMAKKDGKLVLLGSDESAVADCVLADEVTVGTTDDENVVVYVEGDFNEEALTVADDYTITEADRDALRTKRIYLGGVMAL